MDQQVNPPVQITSRPEIEPTGFFENKNTPLEHDSSDDNSNHHSWQPLPFADEKPGLVRIVDEIPESYSTSSRRLLSSITQILVILAILVLLPWAIRIYETVAANNVFEDTLAAVDTTNSLLMFQICSQLAGVRYRRI